MAKKIAYIQKTLYGNVRQSCGISFILNIATCIFSLFQYSEVRTSNDQINISYSSLSLEPHFDLCYYESQPGVVLLLCLRYTNIINDEIPVVDQGFYEVVFRICAHVHRVNYATNSHTYFNLF